MRRWEGVKSDLCKGNRKRGRYKGEIRVTPALNSTLFWLRDVDHVLSGLDSVIIGSTGVMLSTPKAGLNAGMENGQPGRAG